MRDSNNRYSDSHRFFAHAQVMGGYFCFILLKKESKSTLSEKETDLIRTEILNTSDILFDKGLFLICL